MDILTRVLPADHLNHKESREYMFVKEFLMEKAWLPVQLHPKLSRSNTYWLARADSLFYYDVSIFFHFSLNVLLLKHATC